MAERGGRRWGVRAAGAVTAAAALLLAAGCAGLPSAGPVGSTPAPQGGSGTNCCALIMSGPQPNWNPAQIVSGFLLASASFAHGNAIAREYLTANASRSWSPGSVVTIVDPQPRMLLQPRANELQGIVTVVASGREVGLLTGSGQYKPVTGGSGEAGRFVLQRVQGQWRIAQLPGPHALLLPESLFNLVYKAQNLYFYARGAGGRVLVPDPVFVPSDSTDPATRLVHALLSGIPAWLLGAATTAFPQRARLLGVQVLPGPPVNKTAIVSLSLPPQAVRQATLRALDAQLVWTLTSNSYGAPLIGSVKLKVNGHFWPASGSAVLDQSDYQRLGPRPAASQGVYFMGADGKARMLGQPGHGSDEAGVPVPGPAGQGRLPMASIAVSPDRSYLAGISPDGKSVYVSDLAATAPPHGQPPAATPHPQFTGAGFTALSWDSSDSLWVAGQVAGMAGVYVLPRHAASPLRVILPPGLGPVTALRVAPDGARVALIAGKGVAAHLVIAAVVREAGQYAILNPVPVGPDVTAPSALTWYDPDHLLAVNGPAAAMQVWQVPVNGNNSSRVGAPQPGVVSLAAAGQGNPVYLGLADGRLERAASLGEFWSDVTAGSAATYPG